MSRPRVCAGCCAKPVAVKGNKYCFDCRPPGRGPRAPAPCRACGSPDDYYSAGKCARCHRLAPHQAGSCRECLAWGVTRTDKWLCKACIGWREAYPGVGPCGSCAAEAHLGRGGFCRLCWRTGSDAREAAKRERPYRPLDVVGANRNGQQLFFANMSRPTRGHPGLAAATGAKSPSRRRRPALPRQLGLFDPPRTWTARHGIPDPSWGVLADLDGRARDLAVRHGWSATQAKRVRLGLQVVLGLEGARAGRSGPAPCCASRASGFAGNLAWC